MNKTIEYCRHCFSKELTYEEDKEIFNVGHTEKGEDEYIKRNVYICNNCNCIHFFINGGVSWQWIQDDSSRNITLSQHVSDVGADSTRQYVNSR